MAREYAKHEEDVNLLAQEITRFLDEEPFQAPYGNDASERFATPRTFNGLRRLAAAQEDPGRLVEGDSAITDALFRGRTFAGQGDAYWRAIFVRNESVWWSDTVRAFTRAALANLERSLAAARQPWNITGLIDSAGFSAPVSDVDVPAALAFVRRHMTRLRDEFPRLMSLWKQRWEAVLQRMAVTDRKWLLEANAIDPTLPEDAPDRRILSYEEDRLARHVPGWAEAREGLDRANAEEGRLGSDVDEATAPERDGGYKQQFMVASPIAREVKVNWVPDPDEAGKWTWNRGFNVRGHAFPTDEPVLTAVVLRPDGEEWIRHPDDEGIEKHTRWTLIGDTRREEKGPTLRLDDRFPASWKVTAALDGEFPGQGSENARCAVYANDVTLMRGVAADVYDPGAGASLAFDHGYSAHLSAVTAAPGDLTDGAPTKVEQQILDDVQALIGDDENGGGVSAATGEDPGDRQVDALLYLGSKGNGLEMNKYESPAELEDKEKKLLELELDRVKAVGPNAANRLNEEWYDPTERPAGLSGLALDAVDRLIAKLENEGPGSKAQKEIAKRKITMDNVTQHLRTVAGGKVQLLYDYRRVREEVDKTHVLFNWGISTYYLVRDTYLNKIRRDKGDPYRDIGVYWGEFWRYTKSPLPIGGVDTTLANRCWFVLATAFSGKYIQLMVIYDWLLHRSGDLTPTGKKKWRPFYRRKAYLGVTAGAVEGELEQVDGNGIKGRWDPRREYGEGSISWFGGKLKIDADANLEQKRFGFGFRVPDPFGILKGDPFDLPWIQLDTESKTVSIDLRIPEKGEPQPPTPSLPFPETPRPSFNARLQAVYNWDREQPGASIEARVSSPRTGLYAKASVDLKGAQFQVSARSVADAADLNVDKPKKYDFLVDAKVSCEFAKTDVKFEAEARLLDGAILAKVDGSLAEGKKATVSSSVELKPLPLIGGLIKSKPDGEPDIGFDMTVFGSGLYDSEKGALGVYGLRANYSRDVEAPGILEGKLKVGVEVGGATGKRMVDTDMLRSKYYLPVFGQVTAEYELDKVRLLGKAYFRVEVGNKPIPGELPTRFIDASGVLGVRKSIIGDVNLKATGSNLFGKPAGTLQVEWDLSGLAETAADKFFKVEKRGTKKFFP